MQSSPARPELLHDLLTSPAASFPERAAVVSLDGAVITFSELDRQTRSLSAWTARHSRPGDRVAVVADNCSSYVQAYYGVPRGGRVLALINQRFSAAEQEALVASAEPTLLVGEARYLDALVRIGRRVRSIQDVVAFESDEWDQAIDGDADDAGDVSPDDPAWLLFTSGSTGVPKGVIHTHRSLTAAAWAMVAGRSIEGGGVYLLPFPMCHVSGHNVLAHHAVGSTVLPTPQFRPPAFVEAVNRYGVTFCSLAPTMLHALVAHVEASGERMPTLRHVAYGAAAMPVDLIRRAGEMFDVDFHQSYGQTETGGAVAFLRPDEHRAGLAGDASILHSIGWPHPEIEVRLVDDDGGEAPIGQPGEIVVRGTQVMDRYWRDEAATAATLAGGWLHTGDVGRIDADGRLTIVDRRRDVIITGGENVSSLEVEDALSTHPGVDMVAVVGVPDDYWGEAICAVVVARRERQPTAEELIAHARERISPFKRPRHVLFVEELPLTTNGKVAKDVVRRLAREDIGARSGAPLDT